MRQLKVLGVSFKDYSVRESMRRINLFLNNDICNTIDFITHDVLLKASNSEELKNQLEEMDLAVCTSSDILQAGNVQSHGREKEIENNTLLKYILRKFSKEKRRLFLIAQSPDQMDKFRSSLDTLQSGLNVVGSISCSDVVGGDDTIVNEVNSCLPDAVFLKLPSPAVENFICINKKKLNTQMVFALRDINLKVTEHGKVRKGGIKDFFIRHFFRSAALKYTREEKAGKTVPLEDAPIVVTPNSEPVIVAKEIPSPVQDEPASSDASNAGDGDNELHTEEQKSEKGAEIIRFEDHVNKHSR